jgi:hypothetical protein
MARGTSRERYIGYASIRVFPPMTMPGPSRNVRSSRATSDFATATSAPP